MEQDAAGFPQGLTNPGISRYLASRLPYARPGSMSGVWKRSLKPTHGRVGRGSCPPRPPTDPGVPNSGTRLLVP
jgi:hypothetical protein